MKLCSKCGVIKENSEFNKHKGRKDGLQTCCKLCLRAMNKKNYFLNIEKCRKYRKDHYIKNIQETKRVNKIWRQKNRDKTNKRSKLYYQLNKDNIRKKIANKRRTIPSFRMNQNMKRAVYRGLNNKKGGISWKILTDYDINKLKNHLESKFTKGMTWENYGKDGWEIDHIIPKSLFKFDSYNHPAFKACWALSNLQPLWGTTRIAMNYGESDSYVGNVEKGDRIKMTSKIKKLLDSVNV